MVSHANSFERNFTISKYLRNLKKDKKLKLKTRDCTSRLFSSLTPRVVTQEDFD